MKNAEKRMAKQAFAGLMAALLMMGLTACGSRTAPVTGELSGGETTAETTTTTATAKKTIAEDAVFTTGAQNGGTYTNEFLGIGCTLDSSWTYYTKEQIEQVNGIAVDAITDEEISKLVEESGTLTDMCAVSEGNSVNIGIENMGLLYGSVMSAENYVDQSLDMLKTAMSSAGYADVTCEKIHFTLAGKEQVGVALTAMANGVPFYEKMACIKCGKYIAAITMATVGSDTTDKIAEAFFAL